MAIFKERNSVCRVQKYFMKITFLNIAHVDDNYYRVALTRSKRSGRSIWKMKHVLNILAFNTCFNGSDVDENRHFIQGEVVAHRQILFLISIYEWKSYSKMKNLPNLLSFGTEGLP